MRQIGYRHQRTLAAEAWVRGVGFVTGVRSSLRFRPAPADTGVVFIRTDLPYRPLTPAVAARVTGTNRRTTLGTAETGVTLVEHVLAALAGLRIDNCIIEIDAPEPPGLDGSALAFTQALAEAGAVLQAGRRPIWAATEPLIASYGGATIALHPSTADSGTGLKASYILDYGPQAPIVRQSHTLSLSPENFTRDLAPCRTFLLESEAKVLRSCGVGRHLTASELLVFGPRGLIDNTLRHGDEPARHKILDMVGDLALCGFDLAGHLVAYRSGHSLNVVLANMICRQVERVLDRDDDRGQALPIRPMPGFLQPAGRGFVPVATGAPQRRAA